MLSQIIACKTVRTGPKSQLGGAHVGFTSCEYQLTVFIGPKLFHFSSEIPAPQMR
jgi:hypothetical protein